MENPSRHKHSNLESPWSAILLFLLHEGEGESLLLDRHLERKMTFMKVRQRHLESSACSVSESESESESKTKADLIIKIVKEVKLFF